MNLSSRQIYNKPFDKLNQDMTDDLLNIKKWKMKLHANDICSASLELMYFIKTPSKFKTINERYLILLSYKRVLNQLYIKTKLKNSSNEELNKKERLNSIIIDMLYIELGKNFQDVISEIFKNINYDKRILFSAFKNAFYCYDIVIKTALFEHRSVPKNVWGEYHKLFNLTMSLNISDKTFKRQRQNQFQLKLITQMHNSSLLFSISNVHSVLRKDIGIISDAIYDLSDHLQVVKNDNKTTGMFVVSTNRDAGPIYIKNSDQIIPNCYNLDLTLIIERLQRLKFIRYLAHVPANSSEYTLSELALSANQINFLAKAWNSNRIRIENRIPAVGDAKVSFGISACYHYVQEEILKSKVEDTANVDIKHSLHTVKIINISKNGFCLSCQDECLDLAKIGELIAIKIGNNSSSKWSLGTIRWVNRNISDSFFIGVEILCKDIIPVNSYVFNAKDSSAIPIFVLPNQLNMPVTIIAPLGTFTPGCELEFEYDGCCYQANLVKSFGKNAQCEYFGLAFRNMT
jgi:hypothetical protein